MEYVQFIENVDKGFRKEVTIERWQYKVQYKPATYIYIQETKAQKNRADADKRTSQLKNWRFFNVYVQHDSIHTASPVRLLSNSMEDYNKYLGYYLNKNSENFVLHIDSVSLNASVYNYENNYSLSPQDVFVVGFRLSDELASGKYEKMVLEYTDNTLMTGIIRFAFKYSDLKNEPIVAL